MGARRRLRPVRTTQRHDGTASTGRGPPVAPPEAGRDRRLRRLGGREQVGALSDRDLLIAGAALYAGEGSKRDGEVGFANSDADLVATFCAWLRRFFTVDEQRLRVSLYLHQGLDLEAAVQHWARVTGIPPTQFTKPYRAHPGGGLRASRHASGCATVRYGCTRTHREVMGLVRALFERER